PININTHEGHPITKELKKIAFQALQYKAPQTSIITDTSNNKLVLYAIPNTEKDETIIAIHYPEISDILKNNINLLKDPTKWDYLLYLETTKSGKLINKLIPGNGETLLNFKIEILKIALSKKAILLDMPKQDLMPTVEILHHISLRENIHVINLQKPITNFEIAIKLFGINPIFQPYKTTSSRPLLQCLDNSGTLFIKNIHFLDLKTQNKLAEFIRYGIYKPFKGEQTASSNVRIICSTNSNLKMAVQDGTFSKNLFNELKQTSISMPPLMTLPESEITDLTKGFTKQAIKLDEFKHIFELTDIEKKKIVNSKPASLQEVKEKVQKLLDKKSKNHPICEETSFYCYPAVTDPEIIEAARLGKHALKDKKIMTMLWNKFQNQNKIATLLGVNRSSVNRRCREYDLL
ncbi:sigma 54-interacting transcriptional regulator, partial [Candidatus Dependentiae bacterium]